MGWRYLMFTIGGLVLFLSFLRFIFQLYESPRYLIGRGRDADAVAVVHAIARYNGMETSLSLEGLQEAGKSAEGVEGAKRWKLLSSSSTWDARHVRSLFATRKMAWSTSLQILLWSEFMHTVLKTQRR